MSVWMELGRGPGAVVSWMGSGVFRSQRIELGAFLFYFRVRGDVGHGGTASTSERRRELAVGAVRTVRRHH